MSKTVKVELPTGEIVHAEVADGAGDVGISDLLKLVAVRKTIGAVANWVRTDALADVTPDRVSVQFGIKLAAEAGVAIGVVSKGTAEAAFTVTLEWDIEK